MKSVLLSVALILSLVAVVLVTESCGVLGGAPTGVQVAMGDSDSTVQVIWNAPTEGPADSYLLYFKPVNESTFSLVTETTAVSYTHNPEGRTGVYKVVAKFGSQTYDATDQPTTVPVHGDTVTLYELNVDSSHCGYGWTRDSGKAGVFSMAKAANTGSVDFYISDLDTGFSRPPYVIVSPDQADTIDAGAPGVVPSADWRTNGFAYPVADEQAPLPAYSSLPFNYFNYMDLDRVMPMLVPCYTAGEQDKHYALIKVTNINVQVGSVKLESWFQLVPGLRLIRH